MSTPRLRVVDDTTEITRLQNVAAAAADLIACIDARTAAGWTKVPRREVEALRTALNGDT
jgi:hypothetical protein